MRCAKFNDEATAQKFSDVVHAAMSGDAAAWNAKYPNDDPLQLIPGAEIKGYRGTSWSPVFRDTTGVDPTFRVMFPDTDARVNTLMSRYPNWLDLLQARFPEFTGLVETDMNEVRDDEGTRWQA